ncbi:hypothetical protein F4775DRAFT_443797 [Biscogniauxia sp. FL1348]|nr:hypothetical protein F4775DRAFT_443797 [Biscogniauxia sp. FL1348]
MVVSGDDDGNGGGGGGGGKGVAQVTMRISLDLLLLLFFCFLKGHLSDRRADGWLHIKPRISVMLYILQAGCMYDMICLERAWCSPAFCFFILFHFLLISVFRSPPARPPARPLREKETGGSRVPRECHGAALARGLLRATPI